MHPQLIELTQKRAVSTGLLRAEKPHKKQPRTRTSPSVPTTTTILVLPANMPEDFQSLGQKMVSKGFIIRRFSESLESSPARPSFEMEAWLPAEYQSIKPVEVIGGYPGWKSMISETVMKGGRRIDVIFNKKLMVPK